MGFTPPRGWIVPVLPGWNPEAAGFAGPCTAFANPRRVACSLPSGGGQAHARGPEHSLGAAVQLQFSIDAREMVADRFVADATASRNRWNRLSVADHGEDLELGQRQLGARLPRVMHRRVREAVPPLDHSHGADH